MKKYSNISKNEKGELLNEFCEALSSLKNEKERIDFLVDLFTRQEIIMLAKRIKVAKLLIKGKRYREIEDELKISHATIAKIAAWIDESGEGFRIIAQRSEPKKLQIKNDTNNDWQRLKRSHPIMFWPELALDEIIKTMNLRQKRKLQNSIKKLDKKSAVYQQINKYLK